MNRPNFLLVFTDQQRFDTIEAHGNPIIRTPSLNALAERGTSFTRAYSPCPVCVPARYSMLTGLLPLKTGCFDNGPMPENGESLMQILSRNGYQTHGTGKMHFTFPNRGDTDLWGFEKRDVSEECEGASRDDYRIYLKENGFGYVSDPQGVRSEMYYIPQPSQLPARHHNSAWVANRSIEFLKNRDQKRPFFLMTSFVKPHPPFESPVPWNKLYRGPEMPLPKRPQDAQNLITYWNRFQNRYKYRDQGIDDNLIRCIKAAYYSAISFVDYQLGRVLEYLREQNLMDDTVILFTSDHGEMLGDYNCFGKRCFFDSAARIPMLLSGPDIAQNSMQDAPVSLVDVLPTFLQLAGIPAPSGLSGVSLTQVDVTGRDMVTGQFQSGGAGMHMAVTRRFKYIYSAPDGREWLYDLSIDPQETRNRAGVLMYAPALKAMRARLMDDYRREGYTLPIQDGAWRPYPKMEMPDDPDEGLLFQDPVDSIPHIPGYERRPLL